MTAVEIAQAFANPRQVGGCRTVNLSGRIVEDSAFVAALTETAAGGLLTQLQTLGLNGTEVTDAAVSALASVAADGHLPQLQSIWLGSTSVGDVGVTALASAAAGGHLAQLESIWLSGTLVGDDGVSALASAAAGGHLTQLESIWLSRTQVTDVGLSALASAAAGGHLTQLLTIRLNGTRVGDVGVTALASAAAGGHLAQLQSIWLDDTQMESVDRATLGSADAKQIFAAILRGVSLPVARIVFVGTGEIGKSWLFERCFLDRTVDPNRPRRQTPDIDLIRPETCAWKPAVAGTVLEPRVWDFGGQLVLHGVHETFLGDDGRTVYILVLSANAPPGSRYVREEETGNAAAYWLRIIHHFGGSTAPVVIAVTQCDTAPRTDRPIDAHFVPFSMPLPQLEPDKVKTAFEVEVTRIVDDLSACQSSPNSIRPLRDAINAAVAQRDGIRRQKVSRELLAVRQKVEAELPTHALVGVKAFRGWCVECGVTDTGQQDVLRGILHHMGCLFYFGEDRDPEGRDRADVAPGHRRMLHRQPDTILTRCIINPAWLKHAVYAVFKESQGTPWLTPGQVRAKVQEANAKYGRHARGGEVVEAFLKLVELSFFDEGEQKYLFPRGLRPGLPAGYERWPAAWLEWPFVPESAFHRFLVRTHGRPDGVLRNDRGGYAHGRDWVMIRTGGVRAIVVLDAEAGRVTIRFDPDSPRDARLQSYHHLREQFIGDFVGKPPTDESRGPEPAVPTPEPPSKRKGRPADHDTKHDESIAAAWGTGRYKCYEELEKELGLKVGAAERAIDRVRKRRKN